VTHDDSAGSPLFVLTGAPGVGKSGILQRLEPSFATVPEPAREVLAEERSRGGDGVPDRNPARFVALLLERSIRAQTAAASSGGVTVFDRGVPDCIAYATVLGVDPAPAVEAARLHRYHPEVAILEPWAEIYTTDDERTMTFQQTIAFHEAVVEAYERTAYSLVVVPRDSIERRAEHMRSFILERSPHTA
jgi:predicted ATPase